MGEISGKFWRVGPPPVKARVASIVYWLLDNACAWTGHMGGCWVLTESPLRPAWWWANDWNVREWRRGSGAWVGPESTGTDAHLMYDGIPELRRLRHPTEEPDRE